jgi:hypothetical protein
MAHIMDGDGASDSSYACKSIEADSGYDSAYSESESEYFDASSEHSSDSDYSIDCGPEKLVEPIAEDQDEEAPDSDAEEGTPKNEEASGKTDTFERSPGLSRTRNKPRSFWAQGTQTIQGQISRLQPAIHQRLERRYHQLQLSKNYGDNRSLRKRNHCRQKRTWVDVDVATCPPLPTHPVWQIKRTVNGEFENVKHASLQVETIKNMASITLTPMHQLLSGRSCDSFNICRVFSREKKYKLT